MELYYSPMSCSLAAHIACLEAGIPITLREVDLQARRLRDGGDFGEINPKAQVPVLRLDDGSLITEGVAILQIIADAAPDSGLAPRWGTPERYRLIEWLNFITTEIHKKILWPILNWTPPDVVKEWARSEAHKSLAHVAKHLEGRAYVVGDAFTIADAYLTWALTLMRFAKVPLEPWPSLVAYLARQHARESVEKAIAFERSRRRLSG